ncbi:MAG: Eco57I restriction-modification methylase domain-containing protein, partial [Firmicutes bacterium]|nr:Eco57I restriction-modification methylase domain-containing protein [Bacillota bacterium]
AAAKVDLSARQAELRGNLDKLLRDNDYGNVSDDAWRDNYAPFHWISEFYSIIVDNCGFDVIIGNPPYVEYSKIKSKKYRIIGYDTETSGNLYAFICERALHLSKNNSGIGVIIPISSISSDRAMKFQNLLSKHTTWQYSYSNRPAKLFDGVEQRLTIFIVNNNNHSKSYNSSYNHWMSVEREALFDMQNYVVSTISDKPFAKIGIDIEASIFEKLHSHNKPLCNNIGFFTKGSVNCCYFHDAPTYWIRAMNFEPRGEYTSDSSNHYKEIACESIKEVSVVTSILNSSLFYFYFKVVSNCRDFSQREIRNFPVADAVLNEYFDLVANNLSENYKNNRLIKQRNYASGFIQYWEYYPQKSKPIADQIDTILAQHYGFTEEELDYIINYDIKYRMGLGGGDDDDGGDGE